MRRRLDIAASLVVRPDILFLDEPTTGLDPRSQRQIWDVLRAMVARGTTVVLTTQYLEEADALAHRIAVIDQGRVVAEGTPAELKASVGAGSVRIRLADPTQREAAAAAVAELTDASSETAGDPLVLTIRTDDDRQALRVLASLVERDIALADFSVWQPTLDEAFLALTGLRTEESDGVLVMAVLLTTTYSGIALYVDKSRGVIDRFRSLPVWAPSPLVGAVAGDTVRYAMAATVVLVVGLIMGFDASGGVIGLLAGALLVVLFTFALSRVCSAAGLAALTAVFASLTWRLYNRG